MKLFDRQGRARERGLVLTSLRGGRGPGAPAGDRLLIRFTVPNDIKGTGFLVWEHPSAEDERFLYLPSLGRVRRIVSAESQESFVGSDFTYEDIGGREFDDYAYDLLDANAAWRAADGTTHPAYRLESRARDGRARYPRVVSLVRKDSFVVVEAGVYNRRNEREKAYTVSRVEQVEGIWTVMAAAMSNDLARTRTELTVLSADYNIGLDEAHFTRRELERGAP
jgi:hypothetical protein